MQFRGARRTLSKSYWAEKRGVPRPLVKHTLGAGKGGPEPQVFARPPRGVRSFSEKSELSTGMPGDSKRRKSKVPSSLAGCRTLLSTVTLRGRNLTAEARPNLTGWRLRPLLEHGRGCGCGCGRDSRPAVGQITEALSTHV